MAQTQISTTQDKKRKKPLIVRFNEKFMDEDSDSQGLVGPFLPAIGTKHSVGLDIRR